MTDHDNPHIPDAQALPTNLALVGELQPLRAFNDITSFERAQRMAKAMANSSIVPAAFQASPSNPAAMSNCLVAMELANRMDESAIIVAQNLHMIHGKPGFTSTFLIAKINASPHFGRLRFRVEGEVGQPGWSCYAWATDAETCEILKGTTVTWEMANSEGWVSRKDSKWKSMPEQMMMYRAATFWSRVYAPELALGMRPIDEIEDIIDVSPVSQAARVMDALADLPDPGASTEPAPAPRARKGRKTTAAVEESTQAQPDDSGAAEGDATGQESTETVETSPERKAPEHQQVDADPELNIE